MWKVVASPYEYITKDNFFKVKEVIDWGVSEQRSPNEIAGRIADETDIPIIHAKALVHEELLGAMEYMKDAHKTSG